MEKDITFASVAELSRMLAAREVSAVELAQHYLARIEAHKDLNAFLDVRPEATLEQARQADERIAAGTATPLTGIPIAHKDIFVTREWASTAASSSLLQDVFGVKADEFACTNGLRALVPIDLYK